MKQKSNPALKPDKNMRIAIILPRFNDHIGKILLKNTQKYLQNTTLYRVPGALELAFAAKKIAGKYDVIIALGIIIKGETAHFEIVCNESARALTNVSLETGIPIINGVLTCYTEEQAMKRSKRKGKEFAESAIEMAHLKV